MAVSNTWFLVKCSFILVKQESANKGLQNKFGPLSILCSPAAKNIVLMTGKKRMSQFHDIQTVCNIQIYINKSLFRHRYMLIYLNNVHGCFHAAKTITMRTIKHKKFTLWPRAEEMLLTSVLVYISTLGIILVLLVKFYLNVVTSLFSVP